jgi:hypothetical protein
MSPVDRPLPRERTLEALKACLMAAAIRSRLADIQAGRIVPAQYMPCCPAGGLSHQGVCKP